MLFNAIFSKYLGFLNQKILSNSKIEHVFKGMVIEPYTFYAYFKKRNYIYNSICTSMYRPPVIDWDKLQEDVPNPFFQVISPAKFEENFQKQLTYEEAGSVCMESTYYTKHTKKEEKTLKVYSKVWSDHICSKIVYLVFHMLFLFMFKFSLFLIVYSASICPYLC